MSKARLVITAVTVEKRPVSEVARCYGVARSWVYALLARYEAEGEAAFEPRSRRPKTSPTAIGDEMVALIVALRKELSGAGLDAGPDTICWHLRHHHQVAVAPATISRYLTQAGSVVPEPRKRPKSSYLRIVTEQPNELRQSDFTHYPLADGTDETPTAINRKIRRLLKPASPPATDAVGQQGLTFPAKIDLYKTWSSPSASSAAGALGAKSSSTVSCNRPAAARNSAEPDSHSATWRTA
jgi:Homeodomain-like domain